MPSYAQMVLRPGRKAVSNPITIVDGVARWKHLPGDTYLLVGYDILGKRFTIESSDFKVINNTPCNRGHKYLIREGCKFLIQTLRKSH